MNLVEKVMTAEDFLNLAGASAEEGDYVKAVQNYNQAISLDPSFARAYGNRGLVRANLGDQWGAIQDYQQAAKLFLAQGSTANYEMVLNYLEKIQQQ